MADPADWLSTTEQARLATLATDARRQAFLCGRWLARVTVQRWCGMAHLPTLGVEASGACRVAVDGPVFASISHSGVHVACAVAGLPVGVDVESPERPRDYARLAAVVHGRDQQERLGQLPEPERARCFLQDWTRKEAWLKARGQGLDFALMRTLAFEDDAAGDVAVTCVGRLILAVASDPALPLQFEGPPGATWHRARSRRSA